MKKVMVMLVVAGLLVAACPTMATVDTLFYDGISGYTLNSLPAATLYENVNSDVVHSQNNGNLSVASTIGTFSQTAPDQLVSLQSGVYAVCDTVAVNQDSTARYGQIMVNVAKTQGMRARIGMFGVSNPSFGDAYADSAGAGLELLWHFTGNLHYGVSWGAGNAAYPINEFHEVTINYDLVAQTYDVWINETKIASSIAFHNAVTTVKSIAIGGVYDAAGNDMALDNWQWQVSGDTAFTSFGTEVPEPTTMILLGLGASLLRKRSVKA